MSFSFTSWPPTCANIHCDRCDRCQQARLGHEVKRWTATHLHQVPQRLEVPHAGGVVQRACQARAHTSALRTRVVSHARCTSRCFAPAASRAVPCCAPRFSAAATVLARMRAGGKLETEQTAQPLAVSGPAVLSLRAAVQPTVDGLRAVVRRLVFEVPHVLPVVMLVCEDARRPD